MKTRTYTDALPARSGRRPKLKIVGTAPTHARHAVNLYSDPKRTKAAYALEVWTFDEYAALLDFEREPNDVMIPGIGHARFWNPTDEEEADIDAAWKQCRVTMNG